LILREDRDRDCYHNVDEENKFSQIQMQFLIWFKIENTEFEI
jgi:hypothetical protein